MKEIVRQALENAAEADCIAIFMLIICLSAFSFPAFAEDGKLGWNPTYPELPQKQNISDYVLAGKVNATVDAADKEAMLCFYTAAPMNNATVYYGLNVPEQKVVIPQALSQYRYSRKEASQSESKVHEIMLNLDDLPELENESSNFTKEGGIVEYCVSLPNSRMKIPVQYSGRFRIDKDYNQVPCVVEGPFVDLPKSYGATISFETDRPTKASVNIDGQLYSDGLMADHHEIEVTGLEADAYYDYYLIIDDQRDLKAYRFKTAPFLGSPRFKFAFMSGSLGGLDQGRACVAGGVDRDTLSRLMVDGHNRGADLAIFGGDLVDGYCTVEDDYRLQLKAWKDASELIGSALPIYEAVGNHEALMDVYEDGSTYGICFDKPDGPAKSAEAVFAEEFVNPRDSFPKPENTTAPSYSENAYYFDYANSRFIVLNTDYWYSSDPTSHGGNLEGYVMDNQLRWLGYLLDDAGENPYIKHIFLIGHEPLFPNDGSGSTAVPYLSQRREALWELLSQSSKFAAAFFGHENNYNRMKVDDKMPLSSGGISSGGTKRSDFKYPAWQIVSGNVGSSSHALGNAPWKSEVEAFYSDKHYCLVSVNGDKIELQVISESGDVVDECMLKVGPSSPMAVELNSSTTADNITSKKDEAPCPCNAKKEARAKRDEIARARAKVGR